MQRRRGDGDVGDGQLRLGREQRHVVGQRAERLRPRLGDDAADNRRDVGVKARERAQQRRGARDALSAAQADADARQLLQLDRAAADEGKVLAILLQINAGRDPAKFGVELEDAPQLLEKALTKKNLRVEGLMTIAPLSDDVAVADRTFANLREVRDKLANQFGVTLAELSMGMSDDFASAIRAGSTQIRVGTRLFGERSAQ